MEQLDIFSEMYDKLKIGDKKIRVIELFSGIGATASSIETLYDDGLLPNGYELYRTCEWAYPSILAYNEIHHKELPKYGEDFSEDFTKEELVDYLYMRGISANYNEPMKLEQIKRLKEDKIRQIFNAIQSTNDLVNIQQVKGCDLGVKDTDKYNYIMTYSFPCQ